MATTGRLTSLRVILRIASRITVPNQSGSTWEGQLPHCHAGPGRSRILPWRLALGGVEKLAIELLMVIGPERDNSRTEQSERRLLLNIVGHGAELCVGHSRHGGVQANRASGRVIKQVVL